MNLLINGGFSFIILDINTKQPITSGIDLSVIQNDLRANRLSIDFKKAVIFNPTNESRALYSFTIEPNKGTEFRFQY